MIIYFNIFQQIKDNYSDLYDFLLFNKKQKTIIFNNNFGYDFGRPP